MNDLQEEPERSPKIKWQQREVTNKHKGHKMWKKESIRQQASSKQPNTTITFIYKDMVKDASCIGMDI
jgi:hypothetical protein